MAGYTKEFLIDAFMSRFLACSMLTIEQLVHLEEIASKCYDDNGRDKFREYASLDAAAIRAFKNQS
jgi:hypothetical protein